MSRWERRSSAARRETGSSGLVLVCVAFAALLASGCLAQLPQANESGAPATPSSSAASAGRSPDSRTETASPTATPDASSGGAPTAVPDLEPGGTGLTTFTIVCEDWGAVPAAPTIDCANAAALALAAIGPDAASSTRRLDFSFGDRCDGGVACGQRRPDVGWVVARSATFDSAGVRVALDPSGDLRAWPPRPGPTEPPPPFTAPPSVAPDLGPGLPAPLRDRRPVPFCGAEDLNVANAFDTTARTCFLDGLLSGVPVELVSRSVSTEGEELLTLYRFAGRGPVLRYLGTPAGWTGSACGISPLRTNAVFALAGRCDRLDL